MRARTTFVAVLITTALMAGCETTPAAPSNLTPGMAKMTIAKGQTTQAEVIEIFGPPDLVTHRDDVQVWTWDKISQDVKVSNDYLYLLVYGGTGQRTRSSSTSTMLIVYFDADDVVLDYRMSTTRF